MKGSVSSVDVVRAALRAGGFSGEVVQLEATARSAAEAAQAIGCRVEQIVKSLVFKAKHSGVPVLVVASGSNRVNEKRIAEALSEPIERADPAFVRETTGFAIGGVAPLGARQPLRTFVDEDLLRYDVLWAAAGSPYAVFKLSPDELQQMTNGDVIAVK